MSTVSRSKNEGQVTYAVVSPLNRPLSFPTSFTVRSLHFDERNLTAHHAASSSPRVRLLQFISLPFPFTEADVVASELAEFDLENTLLKMAVAELDLECRLVVSFVGAEVNVRSEEEENENMEDEGDFSEEDEEVGFVEKRWSD